MTDAPITLDQYIAAEKERVDRFAAEWRAGMEADPGNWPATLPLGEWEEQYRGFETE